MQENISPSLTDVAEFFHCLLYPFFIVESIQVHTPTKTPGAILTSIYLFVAKRSSTVDQRIVENAFFFTIT